MKSACVAAVAALVCSSVCRGAETDTIGGITYSVPKGWAVVPPERALGPLPTIKFQHGADVLLLTLIAHNAASFTSQEQLDRFLVAQVRPIAEGSVEGKTTVQHLKSSHLLCSYATHTDKSLVGKPVVKDSWMYATTGFVKVGTSLLHFTHFTNERKSVDNGLGLNVIRTLRAAAVEHAQGASFSCELKELQVSVSVPEIPAVALAEHPLRELRPHLRYAGSEGPYNVSVLAPTIDRGMSSLEFADARVKQLAEAYGLSDRHYRVYKQPGNKGFSVFYALPTDDAAFLHAHLFLVSPLGTHGIEVHISRTDTTKDGIAAWLSGFPKAALEGTARKQPKSGSE